MRLGLSLRGGRGLFAVEDVSAGTCLSRDATNELPRGHRARIDDLAGIGDYYFQHPEWEDMGLLVFGPAAMCNHSEEPNAELRFVREGELGLIAELLALEPIGAGQEILIRYRCALWFDPR